MDSFSVIGWLREAWKKYSQKELNLPVYMPYTADFILDGRVCEMKRKLCGFKKVGSQYLITHRQLRHDTTPPSSTFHHRGPQWAWLLTTLDETLPSITTFLWVHRTEIPHHWWDSREDNVTWLVSREEMEKLKINSKDMETMVRKMESRVSSFDIDFSMAAIDSKYGEDPEIVINNLSELIDGDRDDDEDEDKDEDEGGDVGGPTNPETNERVPGNSDEIEGQERQYMDLLRQCHRRCGQNDPSYLDFVPGSDFSLTCF